MRCAPRRPELSCRTRDDTRKPSANLALSTVPAFVRRLDGDLESVGPAYSVAQYIFYSTQQFRIVESGPS